jgi:gamma-glutamyltranspeptidase/glutathione hydrolase
MSHDYRSVVPALLIVVLPIIACTSAPPTPPPVSAAPPTRTTERQQALPEQLRALEVTSRSGVVVTRNTAASWAGTRMLETGGNAVDAAVAAAFALGVAEPGSCGIGGQTYILIRMSDGRAVAIDGSARAPLRASAEELERLREVVPPGRYLEGYKAIATPGTLAGLALALRAYGTKSLAEVVAPSIEIAEFGSAWSAALHAFIHNYRTKVQSSPYLSRLFLKDSIEVWDVDHVYCNPDLACFLRRLVASGVEDFYRGSIAAEIENDMVENGGWLRRADFSLLEAKVREPVRGRYRGLEVLSFPFPGGGATVVESLGILDRFDPGVLRGRSVDRLHLIIEAGRLAIADNFPFRRPPRLPDTVAADAAHLDTRAALIRFDRALTRSEVSVDPLSTLDVGGTAQVSTADRFGNVVSLTQTLGASFGGGATTGDFGFAFNNMLHGFEFKNPRAWAYLAPLQPPMTNMAPTIVVKDGMPLLVLGSAGSAHIAPAIVTAIVGVVDQGLPLCEAIAAPRVLWGGNTDDQIYIEMVDPITQEQADALQGRGFTKQTRLQFPASAYDLTDFGSVNAIFIDPADGTIVGVGDPRRQCVARAMDESAAAAPPVVLPECWRTLYALPAGAPPTPPPSSERRDRR